MTETRLPPALSPQDEREDGFTLIEILVVIIIIGILAAVAIPIFLNQQRTARDSATTSDLRNLATALETVRVNNPDLNNADFTLEHEVDGDTVDIVVGSETVMTASKTEGTEFHEMPGAPTAAGTYAIIAFNEDGQEYTDVGSARVYDSTKGGLTN